MKIRILSDLHLEFGDFTMPIPDDDTILVLAGDVHLWRKRKQYLKWLKSFHELYSKIIIIAGNHEFYKGDVYYDYRKMEETLHAEFSNVHFLENTMLQVDNVSFFGATLWTDFRNGDPLIEMQCYNVMNDFYKIKSHGKPFTLNDWKAMNRKTTNVLQNFLDATQGGAQVIITHHAPTWESVPYRFRSDPVSYAYANTQLEDMIFYNRPEIWIHGHTHDSFDYMIEDTRVICNPRGYEGHELNPNFNPEFEIVI